jgi:uncharacterized metal-binding protein YceD (DUF177 family)
MSAPEFSRPVDIRHIDGRARALSANETERAALAERFGLVRIDRLEANVTLERKGDIVLARGTLTAAIVQPCAVSAEDLDVGIEESIDLRFVPNAPADHAPDAEFEIDAGELDDIEYDGTVIDIGEAVAQSLALAIDPFLTGPQAEDARARLRDEDSSPFAALKGLKL